MTYRPHELCPVLVPFSFSYDGAAAYTGIPATSLREAVRLGKLTAILIGGGPERGRYVLLRTDLEAYVLSKARVTGPRCAHRTDDNTKAIRAVTR